MSRRNFIGLRPDGRRGLYVARPGYDAYVDDTEDMNKFSFSSDWTDIVKIAQTGIVAVVGAVPNIVFHSLGYYPMVEVRAINGVIVYDEHLLAFGSGESSIFSTAIRALVYPDYIDLRSVYPFATSSAAYMITKTRLQ